MNSRERIRAALQHKEVDRIPVVNIFNLNYLKKMLNMKGNMIEQFLEDPLNTIVKFQEEVGHDPVINIYTQNELTQIRWPNAVFKWPASKSTEWDITEKVIKYEDGSPVIRREYHTPSGSMTALYKRDKCQNWIMEHPIKEEKDIELLRHRPDPEDLDTSVIEGLVKKLGNRAFTHIGIPGVWHEACSMRGTDKMIFDVFDRPEWAKEFLNILKDHSIKLARKLARTGIDCIMVNESSVGLGMSLKMYEEFIWPLDNEIIAAANEGGVLTCLHICGKSNVLLERMADSGATCIEPLAPAEYAGDVDLADAKKRIGHRVGLWGGFKERVLTESAEEVKKEVIRCLDAAAAGGGYVLRGTGQIYDAKIENLKLMQEIASSYPVR